MSNLIDKAKVQTGIALIAKHFARSDQQKAIIGRILFMIDQLPTIDAPPVGTMTNADRIRQMTDDEDLLREIGTKCYRCIYNDGECLSGAGEGCFAGNLAWLKQDAEGGEDDG